MVPDYIYRVIKQCPPKENQKVKITNILDAEDFPSWATNDHEKYFTRLKYEKDLQCSYQFYSNHEHQDMGMRMALRLKWRYDEPKFIFKNPGGIPEKLTFQVDRWLGPTFTPSISYFTSKNISIIELDDEFLMSIIVPDIMAIEIENIDQFMMYFEYYYEYEVSAEKSYVNMNNKCAEIQHENRTLFSHRSGHGLTVLFSLNTSFRGIFIQK